MICEFFERKITPQLSNYETATPIYILENDASTTWLNWTTYFHRLIMNMIYDLSAQVYFHLKHNNWSKINTKFASTTSICSYGIFSSKFLG